MTTDREITAAVHDAIQRAEREGEGWAGYVTEALSGLDLALAEPDPSDPSEIARLANGRRIVLSDESQTDERAYSVEGSYSGSAYRALRERAGLSQAEVGRLVGTHANTIARRERGEIPVDREAWLAMEYVTRAP